MASLMLLSAYASAATLGGAGGWQPVTEENKAGMRFFKVEIVLP